MVVKKGIKVSDFKLDDQDGNAWKLSRQKGKIVLLSFHPLAWTGVCAKQMKSLEANNDRFRKLGAVAVGLSVDASPSKKAWAESLGITETRLLSDFWPHGGLAKKLGLFRQKDGISQRANVVIGNDGKIAWVKVYPISELPDIEEVIKVIGGISERRG